MCKGASILRVIAAAFLIVAFVAACLGYLAPFWTMRLDDGNSTTSLYNAAKGLFHDQHSSPAPAVSTRGPQPFQAPGVTPTAGGVREGLHYAGLWAECRANLSCVCFAEHGFKMEMDFPSELS